MAAARRNPARLILAALRGVPEGLFELARRHAMTAFSRSCHRGVVIGPGAVVTTSCAFETPNRVLDRSFLQDVRMGRHTYCAVDCILCQSEIGRFCSIGPQVLVGLGTHPTDWVSTFAGFYSANPHTINLRVDKTVAERRTTTIGHDVWIGARAIVPGGISIGHGAVVGAGAVVTKDVPPYAIAGGVPARIIRYRFSEQVIEQLLRIEWWNWTDERIASLAPLFHDPQSLLAACASADAAHGKQATGSAMA